ncbi:MAG: helix-turn-helix domain-containing protein [Bdellovibrionota bacterium]
MAKSKIMDIGEVAEESGVPASALRYYEEKGLIRSIGRRGLRRQFQSRVLVQLEFISLGRQAGFSLEEITTMIEPDGQFKINRKRLLAKSDEIDQSVKRLAAIRDGLRHAASCPAPSHMECPKFQRLLRAAGKSRAKTQR